MSLGQVCNPIDGRGFLVGQIAQVVPGRRRVRIWQGEKYTGCQAARKLDGSGKEKDHVIDRVSFRYADQKLVGLNLLKGVIYLMLSIVSALLSGNSISRCDNRARLEQLSVMIVPGVTSCKTKSTLSWRFLARLTCLPGTSNPKVAMLVETVTDASSQSCKPILEGFSS